MRGYRRLRRNSQILEHDRALGCARSHQGEIITLKAYAIGPCQLATLFTQETPQHQKRIPREHTTAPLPPLPSASPPVPPRNPPLTNALLPTSSLPCSPQHRRKSTSPGSRTSNSPKPSGRSASNPPSSASLRFQPAAHQCRPPYSSIPTPLVKVASTVPP
ncbi:hypothetical protein EJ06DRAFT_119273 [Trichodelitschia bisporula]|uniref:Uncharacterized protein n=1 Tax=Trichodelitschia bisporula TaxID=703511 RepID=A0A6G1HQ70_9PEZI|nr:hypothetical protein EJ06DRAFT_119273 [Trichodelitschia bisporula]